MKLCVCRSVCVCVCVCVKNKSSRTGNCREWQEAGRNPKSGMAMTKYLLGNYKRFWQWKCLWDLWQLTAVQDLTANHKWALYMHSLWKFIPPEASFLIERVRKLPKKQQEKQLASHRYTVDWRWNQNHARDLLSHRTADSQTFLSASHTSLVSSHLGTSLHPAFCWATG